ncbi:hypothetical protein BJ741DRAFT_96920 [Chytriomyces cf. hyalinus JEL632]|nr:hypothetical protein BJ741DRAFT_96920 [Chytriomyces cf. hyalinus JEL632]
MQQKSKDTGLYAGSNESRSNDSSDFIEHEQPMSTVSSDCAFLTSWQPTIYPNGCCNTSSTICNSAGNVLTVALAGNQLTGSIPTELGSLTSLNLLNLSGNQLTGSIPTELGQLTSLQYMFLNSNQLTGTIPTELGRLTSLSWLHLESNKLTGSIPTELGQLTNLTILRLDFNRLSGSIPCEFSNLKALSDSNFAGNPLESTTFNAAVS